MALCCRYSLITKRYENMLRHMRADPRADDFRMEKNKCDMYDWFELNGYRTMKTVYRWSSTARCGYHTAHTMPSLSRCIQCPVHRGH
jgi:hypothetical protein